MRMRFIGKDSMGYVHGNVYDIRIRTSLYEIILSCDGHSDCPYSSLKALAKNWKDV